MKNVLFASTALVLAAGVASAEIELAGDGSIKLENGGGKTFQYTTEVEFSVSGSVTTDSGMTFSASQTLNSAAGAVKVVAEMGGATITVKPNGLDSAADGLAGLNGVGFDLSADETGAGFQEDVVDAQVAYDMGDVAATLGYDVKSETISLGLTTSIGGVDVELGYENDDSMGLRLGYTAGDLALGAVFTNNGTTDAWGVDAAYTAGDVTISAVYSSDGTDNSYGLGVAYAMGDATVSAGFADVTGTSQMDLGVAYDLGGASLEASVTDNGTDTVSVVEISFDF